MYVKSQNRFYPPPYKRGCYRIIAVVLALLIIIACGVEFAFISKFAQPSNAASIHYVSSFKDVPSGDVFLNELTYANARITLKNPDMREDIVGAPLPNGQHSIDYVGNIAPYSSVTVNNPFSVFFTNAGITSSGEYVDVSIDVISVKIINNAGQTCTNARIGFFGRYNDLFAFYAGTDPWYLNSGAVETTAQINVYYHDTQDHVDETAQMTFLDLDGVANGDMTYRYNESFKIIDGFTSEVYLRTDHHLNKAFLAESGGTWFSAGPGSENDWDERHAVVTYFENGQCTFAWTGYTAVAAELGMQYNGYPSWESPKKTIRNLADSDSPLTMDDEITYDINQFFPYTAESNAAKNIEISDTLDDVFDISKTTARIYAKDGTDVSNRWNISSIDQTITATAKDPQANMGQYTLSITTRLKENAIAGLLYDDETQLAIVRNIATTTIDGEEKRSENIDKEIETYPLIYDLSNGLSEDDRIWENVDEAKENKHQGYFIHKQNVSLSKAVPIKDGKTFIGWSATKQDDGRTKADWEFLSTQKIDMVTMPAEMKMVYALWQDNPTITFINEQGNILKQEQISPGGSSTPPQDVTPAGYIFDEWDGVYENIWEDETVILRTHPMSYTIVYDANGGEGTMDSQTAFFDTGVTISSNGFNRHNYEFIGWNTQPDGSGTSYTPEKIFKNLTYEPDGKVYLYAQWEFYIQMPDTGQSGVSLILLISGLAMTASIAIGMQSQIRHERTSNSSSL